HTHTHTHTYLYTHAHTHTQTHTHTYLYTHTHTHTHILSQTRYLCSWPLFISVRDLQGFSVSLIHLLHRQTYCACRQRCCIKSYHHRESIITSSLALQVRCSFS